MYGKNNIKYHGYALWVARRYTATRSFKTLGFEFVLRLRSGLIPTRGKLTFSPTPFCPQCIPDIIFTWRKSH